MHNQVDVLAEKNGNTYTVECKFHVDPRAVSNVKVPLYINSRFLDLQKHWNTNSKNTSHLKQGWLVTNTRFSSDATAYAECVGLQLLSWDYPEGNGLKENVDEFALYPITTLTSLSKSEKHRLIQDDIVLTKELFDAPKPLGNLGFSAERIEEVRNEIKYLCDL